MLPAPCVCANTVVRGWVFMEILHKDDLYYGQRTELNGAVVRCSWVRVIVICLCLQIYLQTQA